MTHWYNRKLKHLHVIFVLRDIYILHTHTHTHRHTHAHAHARTYAHIHTHLHTHTHTHAHKTNILVGMSFLKCHFFILHLIL